MKQALIVAMELILPCLILAFLYKYEPLISHSTLTELPLTLDGLDPKGYSTLIIPGFLFSAIGCSSTGTFATNIMPFKMKCSLIAIHIAIVAVSYLSVKSITDSVGSIISYHCLDVIILIIGYLGWQISKHFVRYSFDPKVRYPRAHQVTEREDGESKSKMNTFVTSTLLPIALTLSYLFVLIPNFASAPAWGQCLLRTFAHPFVKGQSDMRQRDAYATKDFDLTVKAMSGDMFPMECVWSTAGRFMMVSNAGKSYGWYLVTLIALSYMEWFMRVNAEAIKYRLNKFLYNKPPLTGKALKNYRLAEACSQSQDNGVELGAIVLTGLSYFALYNQRGALGLGFGAERPELVTLLLVVIGLQLLVETITDTVTTSQLIEHGVFVHLYYEPCFEDGVVTPHSKTMKLAESFSFAVGLLASLLFFRIAAIPVYCRDEDVCSCSFYETVLDQICDE